MREILFIRHAESEGNAGKITTNTRTNPLTEQGKKQAEDLTTFLYFADKPNLIVHSKYLRAIQTMKPLLECFPDVQTEEWPVHEFTYLDQEKYSNTTEEQRKPIRMEYWQRFNPYYVDGIGAESFIDFVKRAEKTIENICNRTEKLTYIYSHGWFIKLIWWMLLNNNLRQIIWDSEEMKRAYNFFESVQLPNTGVLKVKIEEGFWLNTWHLNYENQFLNKNK